MLDIITEGNVPKEKYGEELLKRIYEDISYNQMYQSYVQVNFEKMDVTLLVNRVNRPKSRLNSQGNKSKKRKRIIYIYLFYFLYQTVKSQLVWFLRFLALMFFGVFYPQDSLYLFIKVIFIGY